MASNISKYCEVRHKNAGSFTGAFDDSFIKYFLVIICDLAPLLMSLGSTINCSSNLTVDGSAVTVMCSYDSAMYSGYSVCVLKQMELSPKCIASTESGSMVIVNGTFNGEHEVFVNPTFISLPPMGMFESPLRETYTLINVAVLTNSRSNTLTMWWMKID